MAPKLPASAWIVGASSGIGAALARELARAGVAVVASARSVERLDALAREFPDLIHAAPLDVTDGDACRTAAADAAGRLGGTPHLIVLAAGAWQPVAADALDPEPFARLMQVNYMGVVNMLAAVVPGAIARGDVEIAVIASVAGYRGLPRAAAYGPTKAALINLCESLAPELARKGVRLRLVNPGFVATPMTAVNDFPMPFLIDAEDAARRLVTALTRSRRFEITFPKRLTWLLKALRLLPYCAFLPLVGLGLRRN